MKYPFVKMHSVGNDYVFVDLFEYHIDNPARMAEIISKRRYSIGSDGLILIYPSKVADCRMVIFNADGSEGGMCGNGIRCVGAYIYYYKAIRKKELSIETNSGICQIQIDEESQKVTTNMPIHSYDNNLIGLNRDYMINSYNITKTKEPIVNRYIVVNRRRFVITCVYVGNPHCVIFVRNMPRDIDVYSKELSEKDVFCNGINIEYCKLESDGSVRARVYERGSGETLGCGSGACAICSAAVARGIWNREQWNSVIYPGGGLEVKLDREDRLWLRGMVHFSFEGIVDIDI